MTKVIILSYFFPPANFVGAERTAAWYKHLPKDGVFPIIVTRQWNLHQTDLTAKQNNNELIVEREQNGEIHRLPYNQSIRDKLSAYPSFWPFQKALTLFELIFSNFFVGALPFNNFYDYCVRLIEQNKDIQVVIASGRPFQSFFIGYLLKRKFPHLIWIPDYRDEWNTHQQKTAKNGLEKFIFYLEKKSERLWTSNANLFLSVSDYWVASIRQLIKKRGEVIKNGYHDTPVLIAKNTKPNQLILAYTGTLYPYQPIEHIINAVVAVAKKTNINIHFFFIGIDMIPEQEKKVRTLVSGYDELFTIEPRMPKEKLLEYYALTDLFFLTNYENIKGWYPVKLFEYYQSKTPILLCPSDNDVLADFITTTNCGFIANNVAECENILLELYRKKSTEGAITTLVNEQVGLQYSRAYQTSLLAKLIHQLTEKNKLNPIV